jgi:hypothetical protein
MEALRLGEFARVTIADRVHIFWIVHAAERSGARRFGCSELNTTDGLGATDSAIHRDFRGVSKE